MEVMEVVSSIFMALNSKSPEPSLEVSHYLALCT